MNSRIIRIVIYSTILLFVFALPVSAQDKNSKKVTLNVRNGTLENIIKSIMKQTSIRIVYNQELVQKVPPMDFKANNEELKPVIRRLLKGSDLTFVLQDDVMVIGPKEESEEEKKKTGMVNGVVLDNNDTPLILATVNVTGTTLHTRTNEEGKFTINVEEGNSISFSYVGYRKKTIKPQPGDVVRIKLEPEQNDMEELVVTGYQQVSKRLSASSTFTLKQSEIKEAGATNLISMLQGKVPGLAVSNTSGSPNAVPSMRMRGTSTMIGNANPIIVVDGIIRENPNNVNPDNLLGYDPSVRSQYFAMDNIIAKGSLTGNSISGLNVNDVESITFLKDASATAIYGTRAANGVIVITTKNGKAGKLQISYNNTLGTSTKPRYAEMQLMNSQQRVRFSREMHEDGYLYQKVPVKLGYEGVYLDLMNKKITETQFREEVAALESLNTDWFDLLFRNSINMNHHIDFSGGNDKNTYRSSLSYGDNKGSAKQDRLQQGALSFSLNSQLNEKLTLRFNLEGSHRNSTGYFMVNPLDYAIETSRTISASQIYPKAMKAFIGFGPPLNFNIFNEISQTGNLVKNTSLNARLELNYDIARGIKFSSLAGGGINALNSEQYATELSTYIAGKRGYNFGSVKPGGSEELMSQLPFGGIYIPSHTLVYSYTWRNTAEFNKKIFNEDHQLNILAGQEMRSSRNDGMEEIIPGYFRDRGEGFAVQPNSIYMLSPLRTNTLENSISLFSTASYTYAGKYILNGNIRTDASNRFGQYANQRFLPVWSVAGKWNISSEKWLQNSKIVNGLSLKGSYGFQGNVITSVGPDLILLVPPSGAAIHTAANEFYLSIKSLPYPDLKWEKTKSFNLEIEASLFNSALNLQLSHYQKLTTDAITSRFIPYEYGINSMLVNGGNIKNYGYDLNVGLNPIRTKNWNWQMSFNSGWNKNLLQTGTVENVSKLAEDYINGNVFVEGQPINTFYVFQFKGLNPKTGIPMFYGIDDQEGPAKGKFIDYLKPVGTKLGKINGGFSNSVSYRNFSLGMNFAFRLGSKRLKNPVYKNSTVFIPQPESNVPVNVEKRWRKPGDELFTNIPAYPKFGSTKSSNEANAIVEGGDYRSRYELYDYSDASLVSGDFFRCRAINFSYSFADKLVKRLKLKQLSISGTASNLFVIADKKLLGQDPEIDGAGTTALPISKIFSIGLNVTF